MTKNNKKIQHGIYTTTDSITGEIICTCGCAQVMEAKTEDRSYVSGDKKTADGFLSTEQHKVDNQYHHDKSLGSQIGIGKKDYNKKQIKINITLMKQLHAQSKCRNSQERALLHILEVFKRVENKLDLSPSIITQIIHQIKEAHKLGLIFNKSSKTVIGVMAYMIKKLNGIYVNPQQIQKQLGITKVLFYRYFIELKEGLKFKQELFIVGSRQIALEKILNTLNPPIVTKKLSRTILEYSIKHNICPSKSHRVFAAACIHIANINNKKSILKLYEIAEAAQVMEASIYTVKSQMFEVMSILKLSNNVKASIRNYTHHQ